MCGGSALKQEAGQGQAGQDGTDLPAWSLGGCLRYPDRHWPDMDCRSRRLHVHPHAAHGRGKDQAFLFPLGEKHVFCVFLMIAIPLSYMSSNMVGFEPTTNHYLGPDHRYTARQTPAAPQGLRQPENPTPQEQPARGSWKRSSQPPFI